MRHWLGLGVQRRRTTRHRLVLRSPLPLVLYSGLRFDLMHLQWTPVALSVENKYDFLRKEEWQRQHIVTGIASPMSSITQHSRAVPCCYASFAMSRDSASRLRRLQTKNRTLAIARQRSSLANGRPSIYLSVDYLLQRRQVPDAQAYDHGCPNMLVSLAARHILQYL